MTDGPITVSAPNTSIVGAEGVDVILNTALPFHKLDSTNDASFQIINMTFLTEPPNPTAPTSTTTYSDTLVYSYPHGYDYTPSTWFLLSLDDFDTTLGPESSIFFNSPTGQLPNSTNAKLNVYVDDTNVYFYVKKQWGYLFGAADPNAPNIINTRISIRSYVFVEDLSGSMVPTNP